MSNEEATKLEDEAKLQSILDQMLELHNLTEGQELKRAILAAIRAMNTEYNGR